MMNLKKYNNKKPQNNTVYINPKWPPHLHEKSMSAHNFFKNAPIRLILMSTHRFVGVRNSEKNKKTSKQYNVQKSKMAATLT